MKKILKHLLIFTASLIAFPFMIFIYIFFPFVKGKFKDEFIVKNPSRDTTFKYERYGKWVKLVNDHAGEGMPHPFLITASGYLDSETVVYLQYVGHSGQGGYSFALPKGKIDTIFNGELYDSKAEIVFLHKQATSGKLKIIFELGKWPEKVDSLSFSKIKEDK